LHLLYFAFLKIGLSSKILIELRYVRSKIIASIFPRGHSYTSVTECKFAKRRRLAERVTASFAAVRVLGLRD
ncbi:MAG: hypothetical protein WEB89_10710, partial [Balneolales bacterium]